MIILLSTLALVGCSDTEVSPVPKDQPAATDGCECADVDALEQRVGELEDQLVHVQGDILDNDARISAVEESSTSSSSLVVTEYEIMCTAGRDSNGNFILTDPFTTSLPSGETIEVGCRVAMVDPNDRPFIINIGTLWDYSIDEAASPYYTWETGPRFAPYHFDALDVAMGTLIMPDGAVISQAIAGYSNQTDWSSGEEETVDLPVRVVIFDDKPALRPEAW